jgi:predicted CXXCH cytochrome family protein
VGTIATAIAIGAGAPGTLQAKIVYPPDNALLKGDGEIEVLAFRPAAAGAGKVVVVRQGTPEEYPAGTGAVRVKVTLPPGRTTLQLDGETVTVFLAGAGAQIPPAGFEIPDAHAEGIGCGDCHSIEKEQAPLLDPGGKLCLRCHDDVTGTKGRAPVIHPPAKEGDCFACHKLHRASIRQLSSSARRALCLGCHKDPAKTAAGKAWEVPHKAIEDGCLSCHAAHVSEAPSLLKSAQASLCAGNCHKDKNRSPLGAPWTTPHAPVAKGMCTSCHGPHGAPYKRLLTRSGNRVCQSCHKEPHPIHRGVKDDWPLAKNVTIPKGFPVSRDGQFGCGGCHVPHGSNNKRLWIRNEQVLCRACHKNF